MAHARNRKKWSAGVMTESTHSPEGLFGKSANAIARTLASKRVSPKGPESGMRMLTFYINRAGKNLSAEDRSWRQVKTLLSERVQANRARKKP
jgi:tRNA(adenine34) deaminase